MTTWPYKDPVEVLDYQLDWSARLSGDTITTSNWTVSPTGVTLADDTYTDTASTVWLSGGALGDSYKLRNVITTAAGRTMVETISITLQEQ